MDELMKKYGAQTEQELFDALFPSDPDSPDAEDYEAFPDEDRGYIEGHPGLWAKNARGNAKGHTPVTKKTS